MRRAYKFLLRPTAKQMAALEACLEDHRQLYNAALEERREARKTRAASVNYYHQATQLPEIRKADPGGQGRWSAGSQQQTLRRLDKAFAAFFRRCLVCGYESHADVNAARNILRAGLALQAAGAA